MRAIACQSCANRTITVSSHACGSMWRRSGRRTIINSRLAPQSAEPLLQRLSLSGGILHHVIRWNGVLYGRRDQKITEIKQCTCCDKTLTFPPEFDTLLEKDEMP